MLVVMFVTFENVSFRKYVGRLVCMSVCLYVCLSVSALEVTVFDGITNDDMDTPCQCKNTIGDELFGFAR